MDRINKKELWFPLIGYENYYQISSCNRIKRLSFKRKTRCSFQPVPERILKPYLGKNGYYVFDLRVNGNRKIHYLHRLIAKNFIPNPMNYKCVNHINGIKTDNSIENLEWCTAKQNNNHAIETGLNKLRKLTESQVIEIKKHISKGDLSVCELSKKYNISKGAISGIKYGNNWKNINI